MPTEPEPSDRPRSRRIAATLLLRDVPFWNRSRGRRLARLVVFAIYLYLAALLPLLAMEDRFLFSGAMMARSWSEPPDSWRVRDLAFESDAGDRIHAWLFAPKDWRPDQGAILFSHHKSGDLSDMGSRAIRWRDAMGRAVLLYDYPGYGKSTGRPSESGCYAAGEAALQWLVADQGVPTGKVILVGESLGGAIAVELATRHAIRLLVLNGTFTSFPDMAQFRFPYYPARYLVRNQMNSEAKIGLAKGPVLITHGTVDRVIPFHQGERLFAAAREPKRFMRMEGHGHGAPNDEEFFDAVRRFLSQTARGK